MVPFLPWNYDTVWYDGTPYYYADDAYFEWDGSAQEYEVVAPPPLSSTGPSVASPSADLIVYPRESQPKEQVAVDRYQCYRTAATQSGFDPTRVGGGVALPIAEFKRTEYLHDEATCLEARGYVAR